MNMSGRNTIRRCSAHSASIHSTWKRAPCRSGPAQRATSRNAGTQPTAVAALSPAQPATRKIAHIVAWNAGYC